MTVRLYMDVHVPLAITEQLRLRGVDVLRTQENGSDEADDDVVLERARELERLVFTHDIRFRAMAEQWQRDGREFSGLAFGHPQRGTIGEYVGDLQLIAEALAPAEARNNIYYLPF